MAKKQIDKGFLAIARGISVWQLLELLFPSASSVVTGAFAYTTGVPAYSVLFYSLGALCFSAVTVACIHYLARQRTIFERLRYVSTEPLFINPNPAKQTVGVLFKLKLMNMSPSRSMYVSLRRGYAMLQGRTNPDPQMKDTVVIVPAFSDFAISLSAVPEVNANDAINGKLELEIAYGARPDDLRYLLRYELSPTLQIREITEKGAQILFTGPLTKYEHTKAG